VSFLRHNKLLLTHFNYKEVRIISLKMSKLFCLNFVGFSPNFSQIKTFGASLAPLAPTSLLSNTAQLSAYKLAFAPILTDGHESWVMSERILYQVQTQRWDFCEEFMVWHFATKCAAVNFVKSWISSHFSESRDPS